MMEGGGGREGKRHHSKDGDKERDSETHRSGVRLSLKGKSFGLVVAITEGKVRGVQVYICHGGQPVRRSFDCDASNIKQCYSQNYLRILKP